ncbi:MAG: hypothetical protein CSA35_02675 [Dethiosulfovibrio peptidovorans]|nr:MAG: hypothetical protein CSA35_02675 [Dethiosulfovibrio peptidovorans]
MVLEHAEIKGVQVRDMIPVEVDGDPLFKGKLYLDGSKIGTFEEDPDGGPTGVYVDSDSDEILRDRMDRYFQEEGMTIQDDDDYDLFFIRLIELEQLLHLFIDMTSRGGDLLVADYTGDEPVVYEVENEQGLGQLLSEEGLKEYDIYRNLDDFVVN